MDKLPVALVAWLLVMWLLETIGFVLVGQLDDTPAPLVCDTPNVIAVEETAHGVIVRCGPVEVQP